MAIRTALLSSRNINLDSDFSKYIETVSEPGVIEGLSLSNSKIGIGKAWVPCERTNGETIYALVENFNEVSVSGNGYVIISISQNIIDDGSLGNEDGTGIATIEVVSELPSKNYLELYEISELGLITDKRNIIKKVGELNTAIGSLQAQINDIDERVEHLEESGAIDHLEEQGIVGELYSMSNTLFKQLTPRLSACTIQSCNVGDTDNNKEIHIQRIASGTASNKLKLKVKAVGSPTTTLKVEVRAGIQVTVTENREAYWYGDSENILATGSIVYSDITTDWQELEVTLDNNVGGTRGDLLSIVCYQESAGSTVVNANNYYILACDFTQWSEAFNFVSVNDNTRTRSNLMPYCVSDGFEQMLLVKVGTKKTGPGSSEPQYVLTNVSGGISNRSGFHTIGSPFSIQGTSYKVVVNGSTSNYTSGFLANPDTQAKYVNLPYSSGSDTFKNYEATFTKGVDDKLQFGGSCSASYSDGTLNITSAAFYRTTSDLYKTGKYLKPMKVDGIGIKSNLISFGRLPNGVWWDGN